MWPVIVHFIRVYTPYIALPFAAVVGFVGFGLESKLRSQDRLSSASATPTKTFEEARLERRLKNTDDDLPSDWEDVVTSPKLRYRRDPMFDKNK
ncbi:Small integral membrane protein 12 [Taenia solium]|eukprot:TsM_000072700 transcript=TsM_000072700 gene=TsM_000072700